MSFPFSLNNNELDGADLDVFSHEFAETVNLFLPCREVHFAGPHSGGELNSLWKAGVEMVRSELKPVKDRGEEEFLYLPLWSGESLLGVAILLAPSEQCQEATSAWLLEKSRLISREMARVKQYALDPLTGLPGSQALERRLNMLLESRDMPAGSDPLSLFFVEIYPRSSDGGQAAKAIAASSAFLDSLIGHLVTPCHLANGIFGLLWEGVGEDQTLKMADMMLRWLKREGFVRSHIGICSYSPADNGQTSEVLLQRCWEALHIARKRGPFALCSYQTVAQREAHPLCQSPAAVAARLRKLWQGDERFGLVLIHRDHGGKGADFSWPDSLDVPLIPLDDEEAFVYLDGADRDQVEQWCNSFRECSALEKVSFSMGAAFFPHHNFRKTQIPDNCRKALLHTGFFGPGTTTFFDGVSLNISGDIFYNEGDLARAVKEYRLGLQLDPKNINLLNSLGVTLARMNLYKKAVPLFQEALLLDPADFMALFNLGFAFLASGEEDRALENFEKALQVKADNFDLFLQLGKLYCKTGRYAEAVSVLRKGEQVGPVGVRDISHGAVYCFLGEAYKGLGENREAMSCLQRAARHNPRDASALSMLGELYCLEGQGDEIALSLCQQAVELDGSDWHHWGRLSSVLMAQGEYDDALQAVRNGLELEQKNSTLLCQLAALYAKQGRKGLAVKVYGKVLRQFPDNVEAARELALLKEQ